MVTSMTDPDEYTRRLAAESLADDSPTAWFERLYTEARAGSAVVPWDLAEPHHVIAGWAAARSLDGTGRRALIVGAGFGRDAEFIASFGFDTTAFDVSPSAVEDAQRRHPESTVHYVPADLLDPPGEWGQAFDLVVESLTVQALPDPPRASAIGQVPRLVAPGGTLLVVAAGRNDGEPAEPGPPWPLVRAEVEAFASDGVVPVLIEELRDPGPPPGLRWRAEFRRP
jgi:SAM-dependent methyltransferase